MVASAAALLTGIATIGLVYVTWLLTRVTRQSVAVQERLVSVDEKIGILHKMQVVRENTEKTSEIRSVLLRLKVRAEQQPITGKKRTGLKRAIRKLDAMLQESNQRMLDSLISELNEPEAEQARKEWDVVKGQLEALEAIRDQHRNT